MAGERRKLTHVDGHQSNGDVPILVKWDWIRRLFFHQLQEMASIEVPASSQTVNVSIIDTTFRILGGRPAAFMSPAIKGFDRMNALAYSFLITHRSPAGKEQKFLFDLGAPKDWKNDLPPNVADNVKKWERAGIKIECKSYLSDIIKDNGIALDGVEGLIWRCE